MASLQNPQSRGYDHYGVGMKSLVATGSFAPLLPQMIRDLPGAAVLNSVHIVFILLDTDGLQCCYIGIGPLLLVPIGCFGPHSRKCLTVLAAMLVQVWIGDEYYLLWSPTDASPKSVGRHWAFEGPEYAFDSCDKLLLHDCLLLETSNPTLNWLGPACSQHQPRSLNGQRRGRNAD